MSDKEEPENLYFTTYQEATVWAKNNTGKTFTRASDGIGFTPKLDKKQLADNYVWVDELIAWADKYNIRYYYFNEESECWRGFPRDKQAILALTSLSLSGLQLKELPETIGKLTNLTSLNVSSMITCVSILVCFADNFHSDFSFSPHFNVFRHITPLFFVVT